MHFDPDQEFSHKNDKLEPYPARASKKFKGRRKIKKINIEEPILVGSETEIFVNENVEICSEEDNEKIPNLADLASKTYFGVRKSTKKKINPQDFEHEYPEFIVEEQSGDNVLQIIEYEKINEEQQELIKKLKQENARKDQLIDHLDGQLKHVINVQGKLKA